MIVVVLLVLGAVGGWLTATAYHSPGTTTTERTVTTWESSGDFTHSAPVTKPNPLYDNETTLVNRSTYFTTITPRLHGNYTFTYTARDSGNLSGRVTVVAVLRSVTGFGQDQTVLWEKTRELERTTFSGVDSGEQVRVPFTVDMAGLQNQSVAIQETLGTTGGQVQVELHATVTYDGTINGQSVSDRTRHTLPMRYRGNIYHLQDTGPLTHEYTTSRHAKVPRTYGPLHNLGGPILVLLSLAGLGVLGTSYVRGALTVTPAERELLAYYDDRADYEEWITPMTLPDELHDTPMASAESLQGLVNYAIDTERGVIEDSKRDLFAVVAEDCLYVYEPPEPLSEPRPDSPAPSNDTESVETTPPATNSDHVATVAPASSEPPADEQPEGTIKQEHDD